MDNLRQGAFHWSRSIFDSDIWLYSPPEDMKIFMYLVGKAAYKDRSYKGFTLKRGQLFCTHKELLEQLSYKIGFRKKAYNESFMKHLMKRLTKGLMIELMKEPRGTVVTICNYDTYQTLNNYERSNERTHERTYEGSYEGTMKAPSILKEAKELKKDKKEKNRTNAALETEFENIWTEYPKRNGRKQGKKNAKVWFMKNVSLEESEEVLFSVRNYAKFCTEKNQYAKDMIVFFRAGWREWMEKTNEDKTGTPQKQDAISQWTKNTTE